MRQPSKWEEMLLAQIRKWQLPEPQTEYVFAPPRKWRFDFACPEEKLACEVEGATWVAGRHTRGSGFEKDCIKYRTATLLGWRVFRVTANMVMKEQAIRMLWQVISQGEPARHVIPASLMLTPKKAALLAMSGQLKREVA